MKSPFGRNLFLSVCSAMLLWFFLLCKVDAEEMVFGDFESGLDGWTGAWTGTQDLSTSTNGATLGSRSLAVLVGPSEFWKLERIGVLNLAGAARITMDITFIAAEWPPETWCNINKIALMDRSVWNWQEIDRDQMVVTSLSGAAAPPRTDDGNVAWWGPWMGDATWRVSWRLGNIVRTNDVYELRMALQCNVEKGQGGYFYIDNVRVETEDAPVPLPRLYAEGNRIKQVGGGDFTLRGVSLIDLGFLQSWQGGAVQMISRLTDPEDMRCGSVGWKTNVIRIPIFPPHLVQGWPYPFDPENEDLYTLLRSVVDFCIRQGVYVILDWHDINNTFDTLPQAIEFWEYMAPRFADDTNVMYELFNEPINNIGTDEENWQSVKEDMETLIQVIRTYAPETLLFVGTPRWCQIIGPVAESPLSDENVVYTVHIYPYHWLSDTLYYRDSISRASAAVPVILGEWGFIEGDPGILNGTIETYAAPLREFVEDLEIGHIAWVASYDWQPPMFDVNWNLLDGEGYMGCFAKNWLYRSWRWEQDLEIALTISRCQVTAGTTAGQDTIEMSGTFERVPSDLLGIPHVEVVISSLRDNSVIYTENCNYVWDTTGNRFIWSERYRKGEPGRITLLLLNFAQRRFLLRAQNVNLTGLGCPLELSMTVGPYVLRGQADESIVNGPARIPIRLMRGYANELRMNRAAVQIGRRADTDSLRVWGEIAVQDLSRNLRNESVVLQWGEQTFTLPAGSLRADRRGMVYSCSNVRTPEGARVWLRIDLQGCLYSARISNTTLTARNGEVSFGLRWTDFEESASITLP